MVRVWRLAVVVGVQEAAVRAVELDEEVQVAVLLVPHVSDQPDAFWHGVVLHENEADSVYLDTDAVVLDDGTALHYDELVVASGVRLQPEETDGMTGADWNERVFTFYPPEGAEALHGALERFEGGRLIVNLVTPPEGSSVVLAFDLVAVGQARLRNASAL
jgi:hypothetical protein